MYTYPAGGLDVVLNSWIALGKYLICCQYFRYGYRESPVLTITDLCKSQHLNSFVIINTKQTFHMWHTGMYWFCRTGKRNIWANGHFLFTSDWCRGTLQALGWKSNMHMLCCNALYLEMKKKAEAAPTGSKCSSPFIKQHRRGWEHTTPVLHILYGLPWQLPSMCWALAISMTAMLPETKHDRCNEQEPCQLS